MFTLSPSPPILPLTLFHCPQLPIYPPFTRFQDHSASDAREIWGATEGEECPVMATGKGPFHLPRSYTALPSCLTQILEWLAPHVLELHVLEWWLLVLSQLDTVYWRCTRCSGTSWTSWTGRRGSWNHSSPSQTPSAAGLSSVRPFHKLCSLSCKFFLWGAHDHQWSRLNSGERNDFRLRDHTVLILALFYSGHCFCHSCIYKSLFGPLLTYQTTLQVGNHWWCVPGDQ